MAVAPQGSITAQLEVLVQGVWTPRRGQAIAERIYLPLEDGQRYALRVHNTTPHRIGIIILFDGATDVNNQPFTHIGSGQTCRIEGPYAIPSQNVVAPFVFRAPTGAPVLDQATVEFKFYKVDCAKVNPNSYIKKQYFFPNPPTRTDRVRTEVTTPTTIRPSRKKYTAALENRYTIRGSRNRPLLSQSIYTVTHHALDILKLIARARIQHNNTPSTTSGGDE